MYLRNDLAKSCHWWTGIAPGKPGFLLCASVYTPMYSHFALRAVSAVKAAKGISKLQIPNRTPLNSWLLCDGYRTARIVVFTRNGSSNSVRSPTFFPLIGSSRAVSGFFHLKGQRGHITQDAFDLLLGHIARHRYGVQAGAADRRVSQQGIHVNTCLRSNAVQAGCLPPPAASGRRTRCALRARTARPS